jgi:LCP family protein required for cell wall assembly
MDKKQKKITAAVAGVLAAVAIGAVLAIHQGGTARPDTAAAVQSAADDSAAVNSGADPADADSAVADSGAQEAVTSGAAQPAGNISEIMSTKNDQRDQGYTSYTVNGQPADTRPDLFSLHDLIYNGKKYTRTSAVKAYLLLGVDNTGSLQEDLPIDKIGLSDGIFLVAHNTARNTVKIISIPRDTMTLISYTDENNQVIGQRVDHINYAWMYGDGHELSGRYTSEAVSHLLGGLPLDGYMAGSIALIGELADFVGGVPVTIGEEEVVKASDTFQPGKTVVLKGDLAEKYVRYRDTTEDFTAIERLTRQKKYIVAFENQLIQRQRENSKTIPDMMNVIQGNIITNMQKGDYLRIVLDVTSSGHALTDGDIQQIGGESARGEQFDEFYPDDQNIDELILQDFYHES